MQTKNFNFIKWLEFSLFSDCNRIKQRFFLKHGGVSKGPYASLNMSWRCGDEVDSAKQNRKIAGVENYVGGFHVHGANVAEVSDNSVSELPNCDGLMTNIPGVGLLTTAADCQTAFFYDPMNHAIANVHCGWKGNVQNIYGVTVEKMKQRYGSKPENLLVGIGPSLGPEHAQFIHYKAELPGSFWDYQLRPLYFNLWEIARMQLKNAGVLDHHIEIAEICTYESKEDFYSYRRDKICGRHAAAIELV